MTRKVATVRARDSAESARAVMADKRINQIPVVGNDSSLIGIVTDRDVRDACPSVFELAAHDGEGSRSFDPATILVEDIMSANVLTIGPDAAVTEAVEIMLRERIGALPVVADDESLAGIIARSDILRAFAAIVPAE